jgi:hypothetical protein
MAQHTLVEGSIQNLYVNNTNEFYTRQRTAL